MRKIGLALGFAALTAVGCGGAAEPDEGAPIARPTTAVTTPKGIGIGSGRQVVVFKSATLPADAAARIAKAGAKGKANVGAIGVAIVEADAAAIAKLAADDAVAAVGPELSWKLPQTKYKKKAAAPASTAPDFLWGAQWDQRRIKANVAWNNVSPAAQAAVTVAVIDTGVQSTHPDLAGKIVDSVVTSYAGSVFNCPGPQQPDPAYPFYFSRINTITGDVCEPVADVESVQPHGTHVAGTIAGNYGGGLYEPYGFPGGIVGVAPNANIAAYKVFDRVVIQTPDGPTEIVTAPPESGRSASSAVRSIVSTRSRMHRGSRGTASRSSRARRARSSSPPRATTTRTTTARSRSSRRTCPASCRCPRRARATCKAAPSRSARTTPRRGRTCARSTRTSALR